MIARALLAVGLLAAAFFAGAVALRGRAATREPAPALLVACADGSHVTLESLRGKTVLVEFFAVWCPECRRDVTRIEELGARPRRRNDTEILAVALEGEPGDVEAAVRKAGGRYRVGVGPRSLGEAYGVTRFPTRFLIDPEGRFLARDVDFPRVLAEIDP